MERLHRYLPERLQAKIRPGVGRVPTENRFPSGTSSISEAAWFAPALTTVYALVLSLALFHHEMWRNEINAWLFARDSADVFELFRNLKHHGHPGLWYLLLMPVTRLTNSPVGMQILHLMIASTTVFVVAKYAPFGTLQKILFPFGYFPLYQYGVISRNYALGLLSIVITCVLLRQRWRHPLWLALVLFLMSHTSVHACIIAISVTFGLILDYWLNRRTLTADDTVEVWKVYAGLVIVCGGILLSMLQLYPPAESAWMPKYQGDNIRRFIVSLQRVFFSPHFSIMTETWPSSWGLEGRAAKEVTRKLNELSGVYVCALLATIVVCYRRWPVAQAVFLCGGTGLLHFFTLMHGGRVRHYGFFMIVLFLLLWGGRHLTVWSRGTEEGPPLRDAEASFGGMLLTGLLALHAFSGLNAVAADIEHPFSLGKRAAEYIQAENLSSLPMIGYPDSSVATVVGYLHRKRKVHYVQENGEGSFVRWNLKQVTPVDDSDVLLQTQILADRTGGRVMMILNRPLSIDLAAHYEIRPLASFTGAMCPEENFYLYLYERKLDTSRLGDPFRHPSTQAQGPRSAGLLMGPPKGFSAKGLCVR